MKKTLSVSILLVTTAVSYAADKPNVVLIFTDDHGYSDLGCQDIMEDVCTPNIDALAAAGVRMTDGYVTAPQCVPSRGGLLSGIYQNRFGLESNAEAKGNGLKGFDNSLTIAERLKEVGYATGMAGKWHLGPGPEIIQHGFDKVFYKNGNRPGTANFDLKGNDVPMGKESSELYHIDACSAAACTFINKFSNQPFFFYLAYRAPHVPLDATPKYLKRFPGKMPERRRQALAMLSAVDDGVGKIVETLRKHKLEERTLIFVIGDNGAPLKIHKIDAPGGGPGWDGSLNDPLNGEKGMLSEGGIRVPFIVTWKDRIPGNQVYTQPVISLDVAATAVAAAGLAADAKLDGVNLIPFLSGEKATPPHASLYWRWVAQAAIREGKWKYLRGGTREYLFDVRADREETRNLLQDHPQIAKRLSERLTTWSKTLQPPGLETSKMSTVWESYFDHYLDGKQIPIPSPRKTPVANLQGWVVRNGSAKIADGALQVRSGNSKKQRVFIAATRLKLSGKVTALVKMQSEKAGRVAISWREESQKDFPKDQIVHFETQASKAQQEYRIDLPVSSPLIHVRLLLPPSGANISLIEIQGLDGKQRKSWNFKR